MEVLVIIIVGSLIVNLYMKSKDYGFVNAVKMITISANETVRQTKAGTLNPNTYDSYVRKHEIAAHNKYEQTAPDASKRVIAKARIQSLKEDQKLSKEALRSLLDLD